MPKEIGSTQRKLQLRERSLFILVHFIKRGFLRPNNIQFHKCRVGSARVRTLVCCRISGDLDLLCCTKNSAYTTDGKTMEKPKVLTGDTLTFETSGAWCVGNDCSAAVGGANPIGVKMVTHEVRVGNGWEPAHYVGSLA